MKPILFNTEMVRAILDDKKKVTRRIAKKIPIETHRIEPLENGIIECYWGGHMTDIQCFVDGSCKIKQPCRVGDILYVRETWQEVFETEIIDLDEFNMETKNIRECIKNFDKIQKICTGLSDRWSRPIDEPRNRYIVYKADGLEYTDKKYELRWRPSLHMPKEATRIFLKITDVRVERLQDMNESDVIKEGLSPYDDKCIEENWHPTYNDPDSGGTPQLKQGFSILWNSTVDKSKIDLLGWDANPWVWVIDFERVSKEDIE